MANELGIEGATSGGTYYAILRNAAKQVWNGAAFEDYNAANYATYDIALTEQGATGNFYGTMPVVAAGQYHADYREQEGGSPAVADAHMGREVIDWDGSARVLPSAIAASQTSILALLPNDIAESTIKKNTAFNNFMFRLYTTSGNAATGKTVTATRSIDGAAFAACANSVSEIANGFYKINLAAADLNGDVVTFLFTASGCRDAPFTFLTES